MRNAELGDGARGEEKRTLESAASVHVLRFSAADGTFVNIWLENIHQLPIQVLWSSETPNLAQDSVDSAREVHELLK